MLAHQGGWDEILLVAGPIALIVLVLWRATLRVKRQSTPQRELVADDVGTDSSKVTD